MSNTVLDKIKEWLVRNKDDLIMYSSYVLVIMCFLLLIVFIFIPMMENKSIFSNPKPIVELSNLSKPENISIATNLIYMTTTILTSRKTEYIISGGLLDMATTDNSTKPPTHTVLYIGIIDSKVPLDLIAKSLQSDFIKIITDMKLDMGLGINVNYNKDNNMISIIYNNNNEIKLYIYNLMPIKNFSEYVFDAGVRYNTKQQIEKLNSVMGSEKYKKNELLPLKNYKFLHLTLTGPNTIKKGMSRNNMPEKTDNENLLKYEKVGIKPELLNSTILKIEKVKSDLMKLDQENKKELSKIQARKAVAKTKAELNSLTNQINILQDKSIGYAKQFEYIENELSKTIIERDNLMK